MSARDVRINSTSMALCPGQCDETGNCGTHTARLSASHTSAAAVVASRNGISGTPSSAHPSDDPSNWPRPPARPGPIARGRRGAAGHEEKSRVSGPIIMPRSTVFSPLRLRHAPLIGPAVETSRSCFSELVGGRLGARWNRLAPPSGGPSGGARSRGRTDGRRARPPQRTGLAGVISPRRRHRKSAPLSEGLICQVRQRALVTTPLPAKLREPLALRPSPGFPGLPELALYR